MVPFFSLWHRDWMFKHKDSISGRGFFISRMDYEQCIAVSTTVSSACCFVLSSNLLAVSTCASSKHRKLQLYLQVAVLRSQAAYFVEAIRQC